MISNIYKVYGDIVKNFEIRLSDERIKELFDAVNSGNDSKLQTLLNPKHKYNPSLDTIKDLAGMNLLQNAVINNYPSCLRILLSCGMKPFFGFTKGPIHIAAQYGYLEICKILLSHDPSLAFISDDQYKFPLVWAAESNSFPTFELFYKAPFPPERPFDPFWINYKSHPGNFSAITVASKNKFWEAVNLLLDNPHLRVSATTRDGHSALSYACTYGFSSIIGKLLRKGCLVNQTNSFGKTPLHLAAESRDLDTFMEILKSDKIIVNSRDREGNTPLHFCILNKWVDVSLRLIDMNADIHHKNQNGESPFDLMVKLSSNQNQNQNEAVKYGERIFEPPLREELPIRIQIVSDVHVEYPGDRVLVPSAPYLILAGDIGVASKPDRFREFVLEQTKHFEMVFLIAGNHEYYHGTIKESLEMIEKMCSERPNLVFLEKKSAILRNGERSIKLLGTTLWTHVPQSQETNIALMVNDYRRIKVEEKSLSVDVTNQWHKESVEWLKRELEEIQSTGSKIVIATHHAPLLDDGCAHPDLFDWEVKHMLGTNLNLFQPCISSWIYGHTHWFHDMTINSTRVVSNPHGYPHEKMPFNNNFVIEV